MDAWFSGWMRLMTWSLFKAVKAARTCEEALARIDEAGMDGHGPMKEL
jgi:hypothetical protein